MNLVAIHNGMDQHVRDLYAFFCEDPRCGAVGDLVWWSVFSSTINVHWVKEGENDGAAHYQIGFFSFPAECLYDQGAAVRERKRLAIQANIGGVI